MITEFGESGILYVSCWPFSSDRVPGGGDGSGRAPCGSLSIELDGD